MIQFGLEPTWKGRCHIIQIGFRKSQRTRDIADVCGTIEKVKEYQKEVNITICFIDSSKAFDCVDNIKLWNVLRKNGNPTTTQCLP